MAASTADRETKLAALHQRLADQVRELRTGEDWKSWLTVASRFHSYSGVQQYDFVTGTAI